MPGIGIPELLIILVVALLIFGPKKIPEIANSLGRSINEFRKGSRDLEEKVKAELTAGGGGGTTHVETVREREEGPKV